MWKTVPLNDKNSAWRPILGKKGAPYPDLNALFSVFCPDCEETNKLGSYSVEKPENFSGIKAQKFSLTLGALTFHHIFGVHSPKCPPPFYARLDPRKRFQDLVMVKAIRNSAIQLSEAKKCCDNHRKLKEILVFSFKVLEQKSLIAS